MLTKIIFLVIITIFVPSSKARKQPSFRPYVRNQTYPKYKYQPLYRDQVYTELSDKGKELFYAINIHPSCNAKKGHCMPRKECTEPNMLYISRVCYKKDLVCCYDNTIKFPTVEETHGLTTTTAAPVMRAVTQAEGTKPSTGTKPTTDTKPTAATKTDSDSVEQPTTTADVVL